MKLKINAKELVELSVIGEVDSPTVRASSPYRVGADGVPKVLPSVGGITYNVKVGDRALGWQGDHIEPCVSIRNRRDGDDMNAALNAFAQIGNTATVVSGDAKGATGVVTGKHGGIEHVMVDLPDAALRKLVIGDRIQVRACGVGMKFLDFPDVTPMNMDPRLASKLKAKKLRGGVLEVAVAAEVPARIMGSGLGRDNAYKGDYDIMMNDEGLVEKYGLGKLRFGDIVAISDADHRFGRVYLEGAVAVGVVVHSECVTAGHGPGVTTILAGSPGSIAFRLDRGANIAPMLRIGRSRRKG